MDYGALFAFGGNDRREKLKLCGKCFKAQSLYHEEPILRSAHTECLCVLCGSEYKQRLFPYAALTDWFVYNRDGVCLLRGTDLVCK